MTKTQLQEIQTQYGYRHATEEDLEGGKILLSILNLGKLHTFLDPGFHGVNQPTRWIQLDDLPIEERGDRKFVHFHRLAWQPEIERLVPDPQPCFPVPLETFLNTVGSEQYWVKVQKKEESSS